MTNNDLRYSAEAIKLLKTIAARVGTGVVTADVQLVDGTDTPINVVDNALSTSLYDPSTAKYTHVSPLGNLTVTQYKRLVGQNTFTDNGSGLITNTIAGSGTNTTSLNTTILATGTTANSSVLVTTTINTRFQFGTTNKLRVFGRFTTVGTANNVREIGLNSNTGTDAMGFRFSGSTFSIFARRNGVETAVTSGSFNGNGDTSGGTYVLDTNFHAFEITYLAAVQIFTIDDVAIHTFRPTTQGIIQNFAGKPYMSNTNSGGSTTNVTLECMGFGVFQISTAVNVPRFYCINGVAETRTLKPVGGTLQTISITKVSSGTGTLTIYDNTAGSGTLIGIWDMGSASSIGTHQFGLDGLNFNTGLTYVTSGTMTGGAATITWE